VAQKTVQRLRCGSVEARQVECEPCMSNILARFLNFVLSLRHSLHHMHVFAIANMLSSLAMDHLNFSSPKTYNNMSQPSSVHGSNLELEKRQNRWNGLADGKTCICGFVLKSPRMSRLYKAVLKSHPRRLCTFPETRPQATRKVLQS